VSSSSNKKSVWNKLTTVKQIIINEWYARNREFAQADYGLCGLNVTFGVVKREDGHFRIPFKCLNKLSK